MRLAIGVLILTSGLPLGAALAHHGWGGYDSSKVMTITSSVDEVSWANPHVHVMLRHEGAVWEITLAPPFRMQARGLSPELLKKGTEVVVQGYSSTRRANELRAERITVAGKTVELR